MTILGDRGPVLPRPIDAGRRALFRISPSGARALRIHTAALIAVLAIGQLVRDPAVFLMVAGAFLFVVYGWLTFIEGSTSRLVLTPLSFHFAWSSTTVGLAAVHKGYLIGQGLPIPFSVALVPDDNIRRGYLIYVVGIYALHVGLQLFRPLPSGDIRFVGSQIGTEWIFALWSMGMLLRFAGQKLDVFGAFRGVLYWASTAALCALALRLAATRRRGVGWVLLLGGGVLVELASNATTSSKAYIMFSFLPIVWWMLADVRVRRWLPASTALLTVLYLFIVAPGVEKARAAYWSGESAGSAVAALVTTSSNPDLSLSHAGVMVERFLNRQFEPLAVSYIDTQVQSSGFLHGEGMTYLAYAFIPRILWPAKPWVSRGAWFTTYIGFSRTVADATTSTGQSAVGELYFNFGLVAVVLGMLVIGVGLAAVWRLAGSYPERGAITMLIYTGLMLGMPNMAEAGTTIVSIVFKLLVFGSILQLMAYRRTSRSETLPTCP